MQELQKAIELILPWALIESKRDGSLQHNFINNQIVLKIQKTIRNGERNNTKK